MNKYVNGIAAALLLMGTNVFAGGHLPLEVTDQQAGTKIAVAAVNMSSNGFVTIHGSDQNGNMIAPASIGHAYVAAGKQANVTVELATAATKGVTLYAMLHLDDGEEKVYEFGAYNTKNDAPYIHDGKPVVVPFKIK